MWLTSIISIAMKIEIVGHITGSNIAVGYITVCYTAVGQTTV